MPTQPWAVSRVKRNTGLSEREYQVEEQVQACWRRLRMANGMHGTRPAVEAIGDGVEVILTVDREVSRDNKGDEDGRNLRP
jgi:hypothetical protein